MSKSIEAIKEELIQLDVQEESLVFDGCFNMHDPNKSSWIEATRLELNSNLDYLTEAKRHILRLRGEIVNDELSWDIHSFINYKEYPSKEVLGLLVISGLTRISMIFKQMIGGQWDNRSEA